MKESVPSLRYKNACGMSKDESDKVISARWKCRKQIIFSLSTYAIVFDLLAYWVFSVLGIGQDYISLVMVVCVIQTAAAIKLTFDLCGDVLTKEEREYYNSLG